MGERLTREALEKRTLSLHDLRYGIYHCERKWVHVCPKYQRCIWDASEELRAEQAAPPGSPPTSGPGAGA